MSIDTGELVAARFDELTIRRATIGLRALGGAFRLSAGRTACGYNISTVCHALRGLTLRGALSELALGASGTYNLTCGLGAIDITLVSGKGLAVGSASGSFTNGLTLLLAHRRGTSYVKS